MWSFRSRPEPVRPEPGPATLRSYGKWTGRVQMLARGATVAIVAAAVVMPAAAQSPGGGRPVKIVALGDSLTAGFGLAADAAFPARLERALAGKGLAVEVANAGVSGDTAADGLARLDWSVPDDADAVIVELGANDALRGIDPTLTRAALDGILRRLAARRLPVLFAGMRAPPNLGADYTKAFDAIYPDLAAAHGVIFYPFFLDGVAAERALNQGDGLHPTAAGVDAIVARLLPRVEELIGRARARGP
jgi:acyl-CoA thioesterase-1